MTELFPDVQTVDTLPPLESLSAGRYRFALHVGSMADGSVISLPVNVLRGMAAHPRLLMVAGVHGDEYDGMTAQLALWRELDPVTLAGTLVCVPVVNVPAFRAGARRNPEDGVDMNRIFPGDPMGSITHRIAYRLYHDVLPGSDLLLSMHGWSADGDITPYVEYPRDSPVTAASRAAAVAFGLAYIEAFDWQPGLLVAAAARIGIPAIEPEIGGMRLSRAECSRLYEQGARRVLGHLGMFPDDATEPVTRPPRAMTRTAISAPVGGLLLRQVEIGQTVRMGDVLASITDLNGTPITSISAPADGFIASIRMQAMVNPGDGIAVIFLPTP